MITGCLNCGKDYDSDKQGALCPHEVGGPNSLPPWPSYAIGCAQADPITLAEHTVHVENFLNEMYATMIDPVEQPKLKVAEMCELLLKTAREQRELAGAAALPATPNGSAEYYRRSADVHQVAEDIIRRVVSNVLEIAHTRYSLDDVADADPIDKAEFKEDGLQVALGEDTGCLDPDSLSAENCEVLYVEKELFDLLARAASVPAASAPTNLESTDTYNLALAARMHESARANKTRVADSIPASSPEPNQGLSLSLISETIHAMSLHDLIMRRLKEVLPAPPVAQKDQK